MFPSLWGCKERKKMALWAGEVFVCSKTKFVPCSLLQAQYVILKRACVYLSNWGVISEIYTLKSKFEVRG